MRGLTSALVAVVVVALFTGGCASSSNLPPPKWGRISGAGVSERKFTPEGEYFLGRAVAVQLLGRYSYLDDAALTHYVGLIVTSLAYTNDLQVPYAGRYQVALLDTDEICAFSAPGGYILVSRGLLSTVQSEDELAGVLAHELGHLRNKDGINAVGRSKATSMLTAAGTLLVSMAGGGGLAGALLQTFEGAVDQAVTDLVAKGFSREQELLADEAALQLMSKTGYVAGAYLDFMRRVFHTGQTQDIALFATHPMSEQRLVNVQQRLQTLDYPGAGSELRVKRFRVAQADLP